MLIGSEYELVHGPCLLDTVALSLGRTHNHLMFVAAVPFGLGGPESPCTLCIHRLKIVLLGKMPLCVVHTGGGA